MVISGNASSKTGDNKPICRKYMGLKLTLRVGFQFGGNAVFFFVEMDNLQVRGLFVSSYVENHMEESVDLERLSVNYGIGGKRRTSSVFTRMQTGWRFSRAIQSMIRPSQERVAFQPCSAGYWSYTQYAQRRIRILF